ncbi:variable charge X-linked protein 3B-like [Pseudochaenichthys georgianus]|uniref:variable charge X-linked protein 3B-like n=1 Tax=Pseudochaenichthys georgianus TaxID=52239 RepID=UPI00146C436F|nr:acidic repeat-containing protein-like [Pseudochaenichthys georgianus]
MMNRAFLSVALLLLVLLPGAPARKDSPKSDPAESIPAESNSDESIPDESNSDESILAEMLSAESISPESDSDESIPDESNSDESISPESDSDESIPDESISPESDSDESIPDESISPESDSDESIPDESNSDESISPESDSDESIPDESNSDESIPDESIPAESISDEVAPTPNCVTPFSILVSNSVTDAPNKTYSTCVVDRGILLEGMRRLQETNKGFRFTYTEDPTYGPYLQSVNGLKGNTKDRTYWELLVKKANETIRLNVGIGAFIPSENDQIILNFKEY